MAFRRRHYRLYPARPRREFLAAQVSLYPSVIQNLKNRSADSQPDITDTTTSTARRQKFWRGAA
jgi:hypothetical protein